MQTSLLKPKIIAVESLGDSHAKVVMEPFERGYGHTLGNALRRVLLSSMIGYAPTGVTIAGVVHEYSTLDGVQEDVVNLLLNLKGVVFKLHNRDEVTVTLRKEGEGVVTAGDIELAHDCEVINPDHVIDDFAIESEFDIAGRDNAFAFLAQRDRDFIPVMQLENDALQIQQQVDHIFLHAVESRVLMHDASNRHFGRCITNHR